LIPVNFEAGLRSAKHGFMRSVQASYARMYASLPGGYRKPISVDTIGISGVITNAPGVKGKDVKEGRNSRQLVDRAIIPFGAIGLEIEFHLRFMPMSWTPTFCDDPDVDDNYRSLVDAYISKGGYRNIALLYANNILNGRFAWRNRQMTDRAQIIISFDGVMIFSVDPLKLKLSRMHGIDDLKSAVITGNPDRIDDFLDLISRGLSEAPTSITVTWRSSMFEGEEVFPSQRLPASDMEDRFKNKDVFANSRPYMSERCFHEGFPVKQAVMTAHKITNAIHTIDHWHGSHRHGPIYVSAYGGVQRTNEALRGREAPARSFFEIRDDLSSLIADLGRECDEMSGDTHFFFACIARGGVYSQAKTTAAEMKATERELADA